MAKGDTPPFQMDIVDGKLVPASAWDAERLSTYRPHLDARGNLIAPRVSVVITQEVASWARRRYWAILGVVVKTCKLPPRVRTAQDLHDAVRKQIGFVDSHSSDGKTLTVKLKSTSKLDDQQFEAFAAEAYDELSEMTGVDVLTLSKEAPDVGRDETEQPETSYPDGTGSGSSGEETPPAQDTAAADQSAAADMKEDGAEPEGATDGDAPSSDPRGAAVILNLKAEAVDKFLSLATDTKLCPDSKERRSALVMAAKAWKVEMPHHHDFLKTCFLKAEAVIKGDLPAADAREYLQGLVK